MSFSHLLIDINVPRAMLPVWTGHAVLFTLESMFLLSGRQRKASFLQSVQSQASLFRASELGCILVSKEEMDLGCL